MKVKAQQLKARLQSLIREVAGDDETFTAEEVRALPSFLHAQAASAQRLAGDAPLTTRGLDRVAQGHLDRYIDRFKDFQGELRREQLIRSDDTAERTLSLTLFDLATREVSFKQLQQPKLLRVYHVSEQPLERVDGSYKSATGPTGLWTTTDPASAAGRTGVAHAFTIDISRMFEGVDYIKSGNNPWYLFCSNKAIQALKREPDEDLPASASPARARATPVPASP